jgi:hypothetical protein
MLRKALKSLVAFLPYLYYPSLGPGHVLSEADQTISAKQDLNLTQAHTTMPNLIKQKEWTSRKILFHLAHMNIKIAKDSNSQCILNIFNLVRSSSGSDHHTNLMPDNQSLTTNSITNFNDMPVGMVPYGRGDRGLYFDAIGLLRY